jgi:hypothetical protein
MELPAQAFEYDKRNAQKSYGHTAIGNDNTVCRE